MFSSVQRTDKYWGVRQLANAGRRRDTTIQCVSPIALPPTFIPFFLSLFPPDGCAGQLVPPQKKYIKQKRKKNRFSLPLTGTCGLPLPSPIGAPERTVQHNCSR
jgi:hypothetical protein